MIIGIGNDIIDIRRIEKTLARHGARFTERVFTETERRKSDRRAQRAASYAKRFAAKEACSKALGTGLSQGVYWRDMGVVNEPSGKPTLQSHGRGGAAARQAHAARHDGQGAPDHDRRIPLRPGHRDHRGGLTAPATCCRWATACRACSCQDCDPYPGTAILKFCFGRPRRGRGIAMHKEDHTLAAQRSSGRKQEDGLWETAKVIIQALAIAFFVRTFFYQPFNIPSSSMYPTLMVGDYLFVSKLSYGYGKYSFNFSLGFGGKDIIACCPTDFPGRKVLADTPERGDVAVFKLPTNTEIDYIKRVIGLPGDRIQMKDGVLTSTTLPCPRSESRITSIRTRKRAAAPGAAVPGNPAERRELHGAGHQRPTVPPTTPTSMWCRKGIIS
jgi:holo-[acyl-carrier protein] synthase